ncbi:MAG: hypothetical protein NTY17_01485 [Planctomycetia bacterium]|nr:hypothetical protein [Planctomycetia bacterium]
MPICGSCLRAASAVLVVAGCLAGMAGRIVAADTPPGGVANGGFETAGDGGATQAITGWTTYGAPTSGIAVVAKPGQAKGNGLRIARGKAFCYGLAIDPEADYVLSLAVLAERAVPRIEANAEVGIDLAAAASLPGDSFGWRTVKVRLPAKARKPGTREMWIALGATESQPGGAAAFDDVRLEEAGGGPNIIPNGGFEEPVFDVATVPNWTVDSGGADVSLAPDEPHGGSRSLRLTGRGRPVRIVQVLDLAPLAAQGTKRVRLSAWGRCAGLGAARVRVELYGATTTLPPLLSLTGDKGWTRGELVVDLSRLTVRPAVWVNAPAAFTGTAWIDDVVLTATPADEPLNLLANTGFRRAVAHPALPDMWGLYGDAISCVEPWTTDQFGIDEKSDTPVPGARVLRIQHPPKGGFVPMPGNDRLTMFLMHGGDLDVPAGQFTFSVFLKAARPGTAVHAAHPAGAKHAVWSVGPQWQRYTCAGSNAALLASLYLPDPNSLVWVAAPQLEAGTAATPYRPAPGEPDGLDLPPAATAAVAARKPRDAEAMPPLPGSSPLAVQVEFHRYPAEAEPRGRVRWSGPTPATVHLRLLDAAGTEIDAASRVVVEFDAPGDRDFSLPIAAAPEGRLEVQAVCLVEGKKAGKAGAGFTKAGGKAGGEEDRVRFSRFTRGMLVEGKPFFPVMLPTDPARLGDWHLDHLKKAGFNTFAQSPVRLRQADVLAKGVSPEKVKQVRIQLNRLQARGMKMLWPLAWSFDDWGDSAKLYGGDVAGMGKTFARVVTTFRDHPAIIGWYVMDEPSKHDWEGTLGFKESDLAALTAAVKAADPTRPAYINWNHTWGVEPYGGLASTDVVSHDNYAISTEPFDLEELVPAVRMLNDHRARGKPAFEWISGSYDELRQRPGAGAVRVHAWLQLVYGTRGIGYWSQPPMDPAVWEDMTRINTEAAWLAENAFGTADARLLGVRTNGVGVHYAVWRNADRAFLLAVNTGIAAAPLAVDLSALCGGRIGAARRLFDEGSPQLDDGKLRDEIPSCGRRVYEVAVQE